MLGGVALTPAIVDTIAAGGVRIELDERALTRVADNRTKFESALVEGRTIYGVTTGVGARVRDRIDPLDAANYQASLLRSHAAGIGPPFPGEIVRSALAIRLNSLLRGYSAVRPVVLERIAQLLNADFVPVVPQTGSLGASGDLAPSAHAFLPLIGEGSIHEGCASATLPAAIALRRAGIEPLALQEKEALALINGTHFMTAVGVVAIRRFENLLDTADAITALTLAALCGRTEAFDARVHALRPLPGQIRSAAAIEGLLEKMPTRTTRRGRELVQDPYSLRCAPQVHGAAREALGFLVRLVEVDLAAVTDNPLVFDDGDVISAGNFHGQSLALGFDTLRLAAADLGSISERRTFRLVSPSLNGGLPPFLTSGNGTSSGYMVAQYTAAAVLTELRALAHPVSVDSVPTSDNQEDHVSMGLTAGCMTLDACDRLETVLAIEAMCAAQAAGFRHDELPPRVLELYGRVRAVVAPLEEDRVVAGDILAAKELVARGALAEIACAAAAAIASGSEPTADLSRPAHR